MKWVQLVVRNMKCIDLPNQIVVLTCGDFRYLLLMQQHDKRRIKRPEFVYNVQTVLTPKISKSYS